LQENKDLLSLVKSWLSKYQSLKLSPKLLAIFMLGVILLLFSQYFSLQEEAQVVSGQPDISADDSTDNNVSELIDGSMTSLEKSYEIELKQALELMAGVENVNVIVKLASSERKIYEKEYSSVRKKTEETDQNNGRRNIEEESNSNKVVTIKEEPLITETTMPEVTGVLVVADGVSDMIVKARVVEAITRTLGVPSHRVAVMAR